MDIKLLLQNKQFRERCAAAMIGPFTVAPTDKRLIQRHISCTEYDRCLSYVVDLDWPLFTCRGCVLNPAMGLINVSEPTVGRRASGRERDQELS